LKQYKTLSTKNNPTPISAIGVQKRQKKTQNNRASSNHTNINVVTPQHKMTKILDVKAERQKTHPLPSRTIYK
jgi:hypothetical protein